ncbi:MAG: hypothetical protein ACXWRE_08405 [Pseudobdellovibrionaceae bacterium]
MSKNIVENKMLEFPKSQPLRKRIFDGGQDQKTVLGFSLISVLAVTIFLNEWIFKSQVSTNSMVEGSRGIASFEERDSAEGIKWEHELAQKLSQEKGAVKSFLAVKPTLRDELLFGFLEGKYKTHLVDNKIESFDLSDAQGGSQALIIRERAEFLKIFKSAFTVNYDKVELQTHPDSAENSDKALQSRPEVYRLLSSSNKELGQANFQLDPQGRVLSLKIIQF